MAYSISYASGTGATNSFSVYFPSGFISRDDVVCWADDEVDGFGAPVYRTITWVTDGLVTISGDPPLAGTNNVQFIRTVSPTALVNDYSNGVAIEEHNLDDSNLQALMLIQEYLDGRHPIAYAEALDMNAQKITNLAAGTNPTDAVRYDQLEDIPELSAAAEEAADRAEAAVLAVNATSTTSISIATGACTVVTQADKNFPTGSYVNIADATTPTTKYLHGQVTGYTGTSLSVNVEDVLGSGTGADWVISASAPRGPKGDTGAAGSGSGDMLAAQNLNDVADKATARANLGLKSAATLDSVDEDDMASNSATKVPTQQSVKAYVDTTSAAAASAALKGYGTSCHSVAAQSIGHNSDTKIVLDAELFDHKGWHSNTVNNTRITVDETGIYLILGTVAYTASSAGAFSAKIFINNSLNTISQLQTAAGANPWVNVSTVISLTSGDYVELVAYQNSGAAVNTNYGAVGTVFQVIRIY